MQLRHCSDIIGGSLLDIMQLPPEPQKTHICSPTPKDLFK